jgi:hypothetical protein
VIIVFAGSRAGFRFSIHHPIRMNGFRISDIFFLCGLWVFVVQNTKKGQCGFDKKGT